MALTLQGASGDNKKNMTEITAVSTVIQEQLIAQGFTIVETDLSRPWGGFFKIESRQATAFIAQYFKDFKLPDWALALQMDPKILMVKPSTRLSWQYHDRRGEVWRVVQGPVGIMMSSDDTQPTAPVIHQTGEIIEIPQGTRHRLVGLENWGIVAEIWVSTDPTHPTDETDNHRLQDDYGRT